MKSSAVDISFGKVQVQQTVTQIDDTLFVFGTTAPSGAGPPHSRGF
jgi:hypothetical protein